MFFECFLFQRKSSFSYPGFSLLPTFALLAQWSLCCPFFPSPSFTLGVLSVSLRFSSWATSLKSLPVITTVTVIHILFISWLLQHLFWPPFFPLSSKSYLLQFLSSLFTIYVNSVPLSDVCFQFPSLLSCNPLCSPCCPLTIIQKIFPFPEEVLYYYQDIQEQKKQERMYGGTCFLTQLLATSTLVFFKTCPSIHFCSTPRLAYTVTGKFSLHTSINIYLFLSGLSCSLNLSISSFCDFAHVLCRFQEGINM